MAVLKLSQIATTGVNPVVGDFLVGVLNSNSTDNKVTFTQVAGTIIGGASGGIQFNSAGMFSADSGFTYAGSGQVSIAFGTVTTNTKALNITGTFNNAGTAFDAPVFMNIVNTASAAGTNLIDCQVGGNSKFIVDVNGRVKANPSNTAPFGGQSNPDLQISNNAGFWNGGGGTVNIVCNSLSSIPMLWSGSGGTQGNASVHFQAYLGFNYSSAGTALFQDAVNTALALVNAASPATGGVAFRVYNTTDNVATAGAPTNYERGVIDFTTVSNVLTIGTQNGGSGSARALSLVTGGTQGLRLTTAQSALVGSTTIATNSTDGFIYIPAAAGTPVGTPTTQTGFVPMYLDTTNSQLWLYLGGAWKQPKTPSAAALVTWQ